MDKEKAIEIIKNLIKTFKDNLVQYKSIDYKEANVRKEFINKFFIELGWDVYNDQGLAEQYKEVIDEDSIKIGSSTKAPDYAFRIGGSRVFFVEAKKPHIQLGDDNVKEHAEAALQLRRYAWNSKIPVSILTNFEYFSVYDCRIKPNEKDNSSVARIMHIYFEDYPNNFETIFNIFSKEAVLKGSLDRFVQSTKNKKGTSEVDTAFLKEMETWRENLAKAVALKNPDFSVSELNYVVQGTINRILFLRIAEDRQIEVYGNLREFSNKSEVYKNLLNYFDRANDKYNSGIFKLDKVTKDTTIDDKPLKEIIESLYYPKSPYDFSIIKVEILGSVYERFLGETIHLTASHQAKIEEKEEVRKAGGIYYTPEFIVDYIVKNTIEKIISGKTPKGIENVRILDPACGSGTFLVRAYTYLLNFYLDYYKNNTQKYKKEIFQIKEGVWSLTTEQRKRILLDHIFGVDIDPQAVEITKLSLLLKVLENETKELIDKQLKLLQERALPDLDNNIKCGNSVVDSSYFNQTHLTKDDELRRVNPFDWKSEKSGFGKLFNQSDGETAFDVIIGNPPYVKEYTYRQIFDDVKKTNLRVYYQGKMDFWYFFTCQAIDFLKSNGVHSFIAPNNWITNAGAAILRDKILKETKILSFFDFNEFKVFKDASIQTAVFILKKESQNKEYSFDHFKIIDNEITESEIKNYLFTQNTSKKIETFKATLNPLKNMGKTITFNDSFIDKVLNTIKQNSNYTLNKSDVAQGIVCPQDYVIGSHLKLLSDKSIKKGDGIFVVSEDERKKFKFNNEEETIIKPFFTSEELHKYYGNNQNRFWIIYANMRVRKNIENYPNIKSHLDKFRRVITSDFAPYGLHRAREQKFFEGEKIMSLRKTAVPLFTYTDFPCYVSQTYFIIKPTDINLKYLTGLLNSKLIKFWLIFKGKKQGNQLQIDKAPLIDLPLYKPNKRNKLELDLEKRISDTVDAIRTLYEKMNLSKLEQDKNLYEKQIVALEEKINRAVYELYKLKATDISTIETYTK